jgi:hypothetical protein
MSLSHRPHCPLTLVVDTCSFLVDGHCLHACWNGHTCPDDKVTPEEFQRWQNSQHDESVQPVGSTR